MPKFKVLTLLTLILLYSCTSNVKTDNKALLTGTQKTLSESDDETPEFDCPDIKFGIIRGDFFKAYSKPLCDSKNGKNLDIDTMMKYGKNIPYHINFTFRNDSIFIKYDIIEDCCLDFICHVKENSKLLSLTYGQPTANSCPCECSCDYQMSYDIKNQDFRTDSILIMGKLYPIQSI